MLSSTVDSPRYYQYRLAVDLNNVGVDLLEARAYRSAMRTLRESIQVMKGVVRPTESDKQQIQQLQHQQQQQHTPHQQHQQHQSVCFHQQQPSQVAPPTTTTTTLPMYESESILNDSRRRLLAVHEEEEEHDEAAYDELSVLGTPLRIESAEMVQTPEGGNADTASAVLLYNFGLVHRWAGIEQESLTLREGSLRLFKMAFSILSESSAPSSSSSSSSSLESVEMGETKLFLLIVVLNSLVQIQEEMGKHAEARYWLQELIQLGRVALAHDDDEDYNEEEEEEEDDGCSEEFAYTFAPAA